MMPANKMGKVLIIAAIVTFQKQKHASSNRRTTGVSRYHLNSFFCPVAKKRTRDRPSAVHAVTGNPVPVYSLANYWKLIAIFFGKCLRRLQRCFPVETSTVRLLLCQVTGLDMPLKEHSGLLDQHAY